jgi:hypothetical protein
VIALLRAGAAGGGARTRRSPRPLERAPMGGRCRARRAAGASPRAALAIAALLAAAAALAPAPVRAQLSGGRSHDSHWKASESKFLSRRAENDDEEPQE